VTPLAFAGPNRWRAMILFEKFGQHQQSELGSASATGGTASA
jgi:hypothetical protein